MNIWCFCLHFFVCLDYIKSTGWITTNICEGMRSGKIGCFKTFLLISQIIIHGSRWKKGGLIFIIFAVDPNRNVEVSWGGCWALVELWPLPIAILVLFIRLCVNYSTLLLFVPQKNIKLIKYIEYIKYLELITRKIDLLFPFDSWTYLFCFWQTVTQLWRTWLNTKRQKIDSFLPRMLQEPRKPL